MHYDYKKLKSDTEVQKKYVAWKFGDSQYELYTTTRSVIYFRGDGCYDKIAISDIKLISTNCYQKPDECFVVSINPCRQSLQGFDIKINKDDREIFDEICLILFGFVC